MWEKAIALDGNEYDSKQEAKLADWLLLNDIKFEPHKKLPKPSRQVTDFYLTDYDLWVEWDGLMGVRNDNRLSRKVEFYTAHGMRFVVLNRDNWESELYAAIFMS